MRAFGHEPEELFDEDQFRLDEKMAECWDDPDVIEEVILERMAPSGRLCALVVAINADKADPDTLRDAWMEFLAALKPGIEQLAEIAIEREDEHRAEARIQREEDCAYWSERE